MDYFLIMIAPVLVIVLAVFLLFLWGAIGKEEY
ncbi:cytochrome bd oxidase small subunit CydS [Sutcliffiella deserti]